MQAISNILRLTLSPVAIRAALQDERHAPAARASQAIDEDTWSRLVAAKLPVTAAKPLVSRPLTERQLDHVLNVEARAGVVRQALTYTVPTLAQLDRLVGIDEGDDPDGPDGPDGSDGSASPLPKSFTKALSDEVILKHYEPVLDQAWLARAATVGGSARLQWWLSSPEQVTDEQVSADLATYEQWGPKFSDQRLPRLFAARPNVLSAAGATTSLTVATAAAGCRHLRDPELQRRISQIDQAPRERGALQRWLEERRFLLMALGNNPACDIALLREIYAVVQQGVEWDLDVSLSRRLERYPYVVSDPYEQISDPTQLSWVLRRTAPNENKPLGRDYDAAAVLSNPLIGQGAAADFTKHVQTLSPFDLRSLVLRLQPSLESLADRFPDVMAERGLSRDQITEIVGDGLRPVRPAKDDVARYCSPHPDELRADRRKVGDQDGAAQAGAAVSVHNIAGSYWGPAALAYLEEALGEDEHVWSSLFQLIESGLNGTVEDVATAARALAS